MGARGVGHLRRAVRDRPARHLAGAQRGQGPHRGVRLAGADRRGQGRARRGAGARRRGRAQRSTTRWSLRWPSRTDGPRVDLRPRGRRRRCASASVQVDDLGRASFDLTHRRRRPSTSPCACSASTRPSTPPPPRRPHWRPASRSDASPTSLRAIDRLSPWRMELHERADGLVVINDAYNANPDSMRSALETLARMGSVRPADGRGAGGDARARRHCRGGAPAVGLLAEQLGHRRGRGRRAGRPRRSTTPARSQAPGDDGTTRYVETVDRGWGVVARECGRSRRRPRQGVACRDGSRRVADMLVGDQPDDVADDGKGPVR